MLSKNHFFFLMAASVLSSLQAQADVTTTRTLFHAGARQYLEEDIRANTIPQDAWDVHIMGGKTGFDLPEYRRGLYGAETVAATGLYATYAFLEGKEPWVMMIKVRGECLDKDHVFSADYDVKASPTALDNVDFNNWYWAHQAELQSITAQCLDGGSWKEGAAYNMSLANKTVLNDTLTCTPVLNRFLNETHRKVVSDIENNSSWYIRDRSCIESITGTPDQLFTAIADNAVGDPEEYMWLNLLGDGIDPSEDSSGTTYIVLKVLAETTYLDEAHLSVLKQVVDKFNGVSESDIRKSRDHLSFSTHSDHDIFLSAAYRAAIRAVREHKVPAFQAKLKSLLREFLVQAGKACKGHQGVTKENQRACEVTAQSFGPKLLRFLAPK